MNLLYRYITQGRAEADRPHLSPRRVARMLLARPDALTGSQQVLLSKLTAACPEMTSLVGLVCDFARCCALNPPTRPGSANGPTPHGQRTCRASTPSPAAWSWTPRLSSPPSRCRFTTAGQGVNTKTKMIKRQMYGRAGFTLLRQRILLG